MCVSLVLPTSWADSYLHMYSPCNVLFLGLIRDGYVYSSEFPACLSMYVVEEMQDCGMYSNVYDSLVYG